MQKIKQKNEKFLFSVGTQLNIILLAIFIILCLYFSITQFEYNKYTRSVTDNSNLTDKVVALKKGISDCEVSIEGYLQSGNRQKLSEFNDSVITSQNLIKEIEKSNISSENYYLLKSIEMSFNNYFAEGCQASFNYNTQNYEYFSRMYSAEIIQNYLQKYCDELLTSLMQNQKKVNQKLNVRVRNLGFFSLAFMLCFLFLILFFSVYIFRNITHPLRLLVHQSRSVSLGNFKVQVKTLKNKNSMGLLIDTFNEMSQSIQKMLERLQKQSLTEKRLIEEQKKNEEQEKLLNEARFLALQSQTNPHFLFNTLNSISRMITLEKNDDSLEMIDSLSSMLRYNLSSDAVVLLSEEIDVTKEYIAIQKKRFGKRLQFVLHVDENLINRVELPKFILQPLVENAIVHGLEPLEKGGTITIETRLIGENFYLSIQDNGKGMKPSMLQKLREGKPILFENRSHLGFNNTKNRMVIFSGDPAVLKVESEENKGTTITIRLVTKKGAETDV